MADRLTQLQDAVDQLATQFLASVHFINRHHELKTLSAKDSVRDTKKDDEGAPQEVDPLPAEQFKAGQVELAQDLILKEQQIEYLVSVLPGLDNSEADQMKRIQQLQEEMKVEEGLHEEALKQHAATVAKVEGIIRSIKRP